MTNHCPTCGSAVRVETCGKTSYMVPTDAERIHALESLVMIAYKEGLSDGHVGGNDGLIEVRKRLGEETDHD